MRFRAAGKGSVSDSRIRPSIANRVFPSIGEETRGTKECVRFESIRRSSAVARGTRTNAPFTSQPRRCPPSPFPLPRRSAPSRYVSRSSSWRAREPGPPRRAKRRRLRCRVFAAPASRQTARANASTGSRANAAGARRPRDGVCPVERLPSPSRVAEVDLGHAPPIGDADSTQTLLSGFDGNRTRRRKRLFAADAETTRDRRVSDANDAHSSASSRTFPRMFSRTFPRTS